MSKSRPRSGSRSNSSSPGASQPELFCDRSLGRHKVPNRLRELYPHVIAHDDVFPMDTPDEVWLREAGARGWVVLMKDDRIRFRPGEQAAVLEAGVRCFCLHPSKDMKAEDMAEALGRALRRILAIAASEPKGGYIMGVNRTGKVRHLFPAKRA